MEMIKQFVSEYLVGIALPEMTIIDIVEVMIIAFTIYQIIMWVKNTRAWMLVKGIIFLLFFSLLAILLQMDVILWIFKNAISVGIIAIIIVFQPELRSALEQLGRKNVLRRVFSIESESQEEKISEKTITALIKACTEMSREKTGALIVLEKDIMLKEAVKTGIELDAVVTSQLLINIFENKTPLHDGAVIIRDNRIVAATCYLRLSDNMEISKQLGTRHRAAVGVSEESDSLTIVVSEETGAISVAYDGKIIRDLEPSMIREQVYKLLGKSQDTKKRKLIHNIIDRKGKKYEK